MLCAWFISCQAEAADIRLVKEWSSSELSAVILVGDITSGDANEFLTVVADSKKVVVFLQSYGGDANEGLALAKLIKKLNYATAVVGTSKCMSACALVWISGANRFLSRDAVVGFHSVYSPQGVSGGGNAIYGAFYGQLGLSDRAIIYLTSAPPNGYNQVTLAVAPLLDIKVQDWDSLQKQEVTPKQEPVTTTVAANPSVIKIQGADIIGYDLDKGSFRTESADACSVACTSNSTCMAFTYDTKNRMCYQKFGGRLLLENSDAISGARASVSQSLKRSNIVIFGKKDSPGFDARTVIANSLEVCVFECDSDQTCKAFTWNKKFKSCLLKNGQTGLVSNRAAVSGVKQPIPN